MAGGSLAEAAIALHAPCPPPQDRHARPLCPSFPRRRKSRPRLRRASAHIPLSLEGERTPRSRRERVLESGAQRAPSFPPPQPSFLRRQESSRRDSATDGAQAPSPRILRRLVIPAKAGTYWQASSFPRKREPTPAPIAAPMTVIPAKAGTSPHDARKRPHPPLPKNGERGMRTRRERVLPTGRAVSVGTARGRPAHKEHRNRTRILPAEPVAPTASGNLPHDRHSRVGGNPTPFEARKRRIPPFPIMGEDDNDKWRGRRERGGRGYCGRRVGGQRRNGARARNSPHRSG